MQLEKSRVIEDLKHLILESSGKHNTPDFSGPDWDKIIEIVWKLSQRAYEMGKLD